MKSTRINIFRSKADSNVELYSIVLSYDEIRTLRDVISHVGGDDESRKIHIDTLIDKLNRRGIFFKFTTDLEGVIRLKSKFSVEQIRDVNLGAK